MNMQIERQAYSYNHANDNHYLVQHNQVLKCICQTCTCGKHQCPKKPIKTDFQTSYSRQYKKFNPLPAGQRAPYRYDDRHYSPDVLKSNYQQNYQKQVEFVQQKPLSNSRFQEVGRTIMAPPVPFSGVSSYKDQFQGYKIARNVQAQNPQFEYQSPVNNYNQKIKNQVKFEGISSYKSSFLPIENKKMEYKLPQYKRPDVPFYGSSSYQQQYKPFSIEPHQQFFESRIYRNSPNVKFEGKSAYTDQFQPYQIRHPQPRQYENTKKIECQLDQMVLPRVNYINNKEHVYIDPQNKKFY